MIRCIKSGYLIKACSLSSEQISLRLMTVRQRDKTPCRTTLVLNCVISIYFKSSFLTLRPPGESFHNALVHSRDLKFGLIHKSFVF